jgi:hypothetical protein
VERRLPLHRGRRLRIVGQELELDLLGGSGVGEGEAGELGLASGARGVEGPGARLPVRERSRLQAHRFEPEGAEALGAELLGPAIGGVSGPANALGVDPLDPPEDLFLPRHQLVAHRSPPLRPS